MLNRQQLKNKFTESQWTSTHRIGNNLNIQHIASMALFCCFILFTIGLDVAHAIFFSISKQSKIDEESSLSCVKSKLTCYVYLVHISM